MIYIYGNQTPDAAITAGLQRLLKETNNDDNDELHFRFCKCWIVGTTMLQRFWCYFPIYYITSMSLKLCL